MLDEIDAGNEYGIKDTSNHDFNIEVKIFDCYSSDVNTSLDNGCREIAKKTKKQNQNIILNLDDYPTEVISNLKERIISKAINSGDLKRLQELIIIKDEKVEAWYVR